MQGYHELLQFINQMSISKDEALCENSKVMLSNLVYHQEYRDVFVSLLRNYNEVVQVGLLIIKLKNCVGLQKHESYYAWRKHPPNLPRVKVSCRVSWSYFCTIFRCSFVLFLESVISICSCGGNAPLRAYDGTLLPRQQSHDRTAEEEKGKT